MKIEWLLCGRQYREVNYRSVPIAVVRGSPPIGQIPTDLITKGPGMKRIAWIVLGWIMLLPSAQADAESTKESPTANRQMITNDLEARGKQLRSAIDERYKQLASGEMKSSGYPNNDITDVVTQYVPVGISFDEAEIILRSAGFKIGPRGSSPLTPKRFAVDAVIDKYVTTIIGHTDISVSLEPLSSTDWRLVKKVIAGISRESL